MLDIEPVLSPLVSSLSDKNYETSLACYEFWVELGQTYSQIPSGLIFDTIREHKASLCPPEGSIFPTPPLILRFARDAESSPILAPHSVGLLNRLCTSTLQGFFHTGIGTTYTSSGYRTSHLVSANLVAHCANLGYIEETAIRNHIIQSLISYPYLHDHLAEALIVLFKIAGATFAAYADPSVIDRCLDLLKGHGSFKGEANVSELCQGNTAGIKIKFKELIELRQSGWEGLPPPPVFTTRKLKPIDQGQNDPNETPAAITLGLPNVDLKPQVSPPLTPESVTASETETTPASPAITQSPSISVSALSDFTMTDTSDDQSPVDPTAIMPHDTFYLEDGNAEVLCGNTLFRLHPSILSFHSPVLRQMFSQAILATAESPNGCPRILSSDTAMDFATLLKMIYLPG